MGSLCPDCQRKAETNPLRIFDCKVETCREIARRFPEITGYLDPECAGHFEKFRSYLDLYGIAHRIEPRLVRGIDYYTKTTFEITASKLGAQNSILGGGRYDDMMKDFGGPDICAIGFAMGVERLLSVAELEPAGDKFIYLAYMGDEAKSEAILLARFLRSHDIECLLEFKERGLKSQLGRASKLGASWTLIVGEEEVGKGRYQLKDMEAGAQVEAGKQDLLEILGRSDS
jgi:histidyl-tRNA synthetase